MFRLELLVVVLIVAESSTSKSRSSFLDQELNNTKVMVTTGEDLTLNCRVQRFQKSIVSWSVSRETSLDLLTVGNLTFSGDPRHSILRQRHNDWVLVIQSVTMEDSGTYICTVQTYPPQN